MGEVDNSAAFSRNAVNRLEAMFASMPELDGVRIASLDKSDLEALQDRFERAKQADVFELFLQKMDAYDFA